MNWFDRFINDVMFYFYLMAVMVGITGFTGFFLLINYHKIHITNFIV